MFEIAVVFNYLLVGGREQKYYFLRGRVQTPILGQSRSTNRLTIYHVADRSRF